MPDDKFDTGGFTRCFANLCDEIQQRVGVGHFGMTIGTDGILSDGYPSGAGDDLGNFFSGEDAALARFCALREFYLKHFDRWICG